MTLLNNEPEQNKPLNTWRLFYSAEEAEFISEFQAYLKSFSRNYIESFKILYRMMHNYELLNNLTMRVSDLEEELKLLKNKQEPAPVTRALPKTLGN